MSVISRNEDKYIINNFKCNAKIHLTMDEKKFIPLYAEHIHFLVTEAGWLVTKIYQHYAFDQCKFKKNFVIMNQKSRQQTTSPIERDFYKHLNNANFGIDCRTNISSCTFEPIYDEIGEIGYIKKIDSIFNNKKYSDFSEINFLKEKVEEKYNKLFLALDRKDRTYEARKYSLKNRKEEDLDSINSMNEHKKKIGKKRAFFDIEEKIENVLKSKTTKMLVDFWAEESASIKSFTIKKINQIEITTSVLSRKMLSLMGFIYELVETFSFPNEKVKIIYDKYLIETVYIYHVLTDTDNTWLQFMFISNPKSDICEKKSRDIIFEVIIASEIYDRFDTLNKY